MGSVMAPVRFSWSGSRVLGPECASGHDCDVVGAATVQGVSYQILAELTGARHRLNPLANPIIRNMLGQPITAEQNDGTPIADDSRYDRRGLRPSDRARKHVGPLAALSFGLRQRSRIDEFLCPRLIPCDLRQLTVLEHIAPTVTNLELGSKGV